MDKTNKAGDARGMHKRTPELAKKQGARTIERAQAGLVRSCDNRVGKHLRINRNRIYNKYLEEADVAS